MRYAYCPHCGEKYNEQPYNGITLGLVRQVGDTMGQAVEFKDRAAVLAAIVSLAHYLSSGVPRPVDE